MSQENSGLPPPPSKKINRNMRISIAIILLLLVAVTYYVYQSSSFDFTVSASDSSGSRTRGNSISILVYTRSTGGTPQPVTVSAYGDMSLMMSYSNPSTSNPDFTCVLTIFIPVSTNPGSYPITIYGIGGGKEHTVTYTLTVLS